MPANFSITPKSATVIVDAKTKVYGQADPALTYSTTGLVGLDSLTGALTRAAGEGVGSYSIMQGTVDNPNYSITFVPASFSITPKSATVTADAKTKVYGSADPALTYSTTGLVGLDSLTGALTRAPGEGVGSYAITQGTVDNPNYSITFVGANLTITPASVNVTATSTSRAYGAANPVFGFTYGPFQGA